MFQKRSLILPLVTLTLTFVPTLEALPSTWHGITYYPSRHTVTGMLYDWNTIDATTGQRVYTMADNDMSTLAGMGINVLTLGLWDQSILQDYTNNDTRGFCSTDSVLNNVYDSGGLCSGTLSGTTVNDPSQSKALDSYGTAQTGLLWSNLDDFVTRAGNHGLYVVFTFLNGAMYHMGNHNDPTGVHAIVSPCSSFSTYYSAWTDKFISYFGGRHGNIAGWVHGWNFGPLASSGVSLLGNSCNSNTIWGATYSHMQASAASAFGSAVPVVVGGMFFGIDGNDVQARSSSGYAWTTTGAQQRAKAAQDTLGYAPDLFGIGGYNANSHDFYNALTDLSSGTPPSDGVNIPASKIFTEEFGISTVLSDAPGGDFTPGLPTHWFPYVIDNQSPVTTRAGQSQWVQNTVCAMQDAGIAKMSYWNYYDTISWYNTYSPIGTPYSELQILGLFGLVTEGGTSKGAATALSGVYTGSSYYSCPSAVSTTEPPVVEGTPGTLYVVPNQPLRYYWAVTDENSLTLSRSNSSNDTIYSCITGNAISSGSSLNGSCGYTYVDPYGSGAFSSQTLTLTATDTYGSRTTEGNVVVSNVTVLTKPEIITIADSLGGTITSSSILSITAKGLDDSGGNTAVLTNTSTSTQYYLQPGGGHPSYWSYAYDRLIDGLYGSVPAGTYTVQIKNPVWSTWSDAVNLTIH